MSDYSELKQKAEAATPGPWRGYKNSGYVYGSDVIVAKCGEFKDKELLRFNKERWGNDTAYIAAASPSAILAILAELEALRAALTDIANLADPKGGPASETDTRILTIAVLAVEGNKA